MCVTWRHEGACVSHGGMRGHVCHMAACVPHGGMRGHVCHNEYAL